MAGWGGKPGVLDENEPWGLPQLIKKEGFGRERTLRVLESLIDYEREKMARGKNVGCQHERCRKANCLLGGRFEVGEDKGRMKSMQKGGKQKKERCWLGERERRWEGLPKTHARGIIPLGERSPPNSDGLVIQGTVREGVKRGGSCQGLGCRKCM